MTMKKHDFIVFAFFFIPLIVCGQPLGSPLNMVFVQGGTLALGCTNEQKNCENDECPEREVNVSDFLINKYEVTQGQWKDVMDGNNPSICQNCGDNCPVEQISWYQAAVFCNRLSERYGFRPCYYQNPSFSRVYGKNNNGSWPFEPVNSGPIYWDQTANGFRFPTEAEWEYAARGGNIALAQTRYCGSNNIDDVGWYYTNSTNPSYFSPILGGRGTRPVGMKAPNALGLYDMSGNVWEFCYDFYVNPCNVAQTCNPANDSPSGNRTARGGAISAFLDNMRISNRSDNAGGGLVPTEYILKLVGIRLVRTP